MRSSVLLPQPDGPTSTMNSPSSIASVTSSTATTSPGKRLVTPVQCDPRHGQSSREWPLRISQPSSRDHGDLLDAQAPRAGVCARLERHDHAGLEHGRPVGDDARLLVVGRAEAVAGVVRVVEARDRARVQVAGAHAGLQLGERPVERLAGAGVAPRARPAAGSPSANVAHESPHQAPRRGTRSQSTRSPSASARSEGGPPTSAVRVAADQVGQHRQALAGRGLHGLDDARPQLQLAHARPRVLAGGGLPGVADADRGADVLELLGRLDGARAGQRGRGVDDALLAQRAGQRQRERLRLDADARRQRDAWRAPRPGAHARRAGRP